MSKYNAVRVTKLEELQQAVVEHKTVILVDNPNITKKIKEICEHDVKSQKKADAALKVGARSAGAAVGFFVLGFVGVGFFEPLLIIGAIGMGISIMVSGISMSVGVGKKIINAITQDLTNYKWFESNKKLVLYKYRGSDSFNPDKDEVVGYKK